MNEFLGLFRRLNAFILNLSEAFSPAPWPGRAFFAAIVISDGEPQVGCCGGRRNLCDFRATRRPRGNAVVAVSAGAHATAM
jgi:hypothetical protein